MLGRPYTVSVELAVTEGLRRSVGHVTEEVKLAIVFSFPKLTRLEQISLCFFVWFGSCRLVALASGGESI